MYLSISQSVLILFTEGALLVFNLYHLKKELFEDLTDEELALLIGDP